MVDVYSFNLVTEPFIPCINMNDEIEYHSIQTLFENSKQLKRIFHSQAMSTLALYRLLIVILARSKVVTDDNWEDVFEDGPVAGINEYLSLYKNRFDLFDAERPFLQMPLNKEKEITLKPIHVLSHVTVSSACFFERVDNNVPKPISFQEAACQLISYQFLGYDEGGGGKIGANSPFVSTGGISWIINGKNLWETLLLNLLGFIKYDIEHQSEGEDCASWEIDLPNIEEKNYYPKGICHCFSWMSRWVNLVPGEKGVSWFNLKLGKPKKAGGKDKSGEKYGWDYEMPEANPMTAYVNGSFIKYKDQEFWKNYYTLYGQTEKCRCDNVTLAMIRLKGMGPEYRKFMLDLSAYILHKHCSQVKFHKISEEHFPLYLSLCENKKIFEFLEKCMSYVNEIEEILQKYIDKIYDFDDSNNKEKSLPYINQYRWLSEDCFWDILSKLVNNIDEDDNVGIEIYWVKNLIKFAKNIFRDALDDLPVNTEILEKLYDRSKGQVRKFYKDLLKYERMQ